MNAKENINGTEKHYHKSVTKLQKQNGKNENL